MIDFGNPQTGAVTGYYTVTGSTDFSVGTSDCQTRMCWVRMESGEVTTSGTDYIWSHGTGYSAGNTCHLYTNYSSGARFEWKWENETVAVLSMGTLDDGVPVLLVADTDIANSNARLRAARPGDTSVGDSGDVGATFTAFTGSTYDMYFGARGSADNLGWQGRAGEFLMLTSVGSSAALLSDDEILAIANGAHYLDVVDMSLATFYWRALIDTGGNQADETNAHTVTRTLGTSLADDQGAPMALPWAAYLPGVAAAPGGLGIPIAAYHYNHNVGANL